MLGRILRGPRTSASMAMRTSCNARGRLRACELSPLRPHPEEPEQSEGVSKDGRGSEPAVMVRDGAPRAPPHHEAERVELVPNWPRLKDSQPLRMTEIVQRTWTVR